METLSIIVPCFNEEEALPRYLQRMEQVERRFKEQEVRVELILVDDGSTDGTLEVMRRAGERKENLTHLSFTRNFGKEVSLLAGMRRAGGELVAVMDVDLQDPPGLLFSMYRGIRKEGYDCVAARRADRKGEGRARSLGGEAFYAGMRRITGLPFAKGERDYRMMRAEVAGEFLKCGEHSRFFKGLFHWMGYRTKWLSYPNRERVSGKTKWPLKALLGYGLNGAVEFSDLPLLASAGAGGFWSVILASGLFRGKNGKGTGITGGLLLAELGILSVYVGKIYREVQGRPDYVVKERKEDEKN